MFEIIVAYDKNGLIGVDGTLPWNIRDDLIRFSQLTMGHIVIMGRKTFESLPNGPLKGRTNVNLTRENPNMIENNMQENVYITNILSFYTVLGSLQQKGQKLFIIGGGEIYDLLFDICTTIHATVVDGDFSGKKSATNTYFPRLTEIDKVFQKTNESNMMVSDDNMQYQYITYERRDDLY
jgi:dihydrofolate reductase